MTEPATSHIDLAIEGPIAILTLKRAEKLNAINEPMITEMQGLIRTIDRDRGVRVVILTGEGEKAFSAGGDIEAWSGQKPQDFGQFWVREGHQVFDSLARLRQPVIAVLNGHALGGGLELAAVADFRIAEDHAKIGQPETSLGIIPGWSGTQRAVRRFGVQTVRRMALFGEVFTADEAHSLGIVDDVAPKGGGLVRAAEIAKKVCERGPLATEATKMLINAAEGEERERVLDALAGMAIASSEELSEGLSAFREKRMPTFNEPGRGS